MNGSSDYVLSRKLKMLKKVLVIWNKEVFSSVNTKTNKVLEELQMLEQAAEGRLLT